MSVKSGFIRKLIGKLKRLFGGAAAKSRRGRKDNGPREHGVSASCRICHLTQSGVTTCQS